MTIFDRFSNFDQDWYRLSNICGQYRSIIVIEMLCHQIQYSGD